MHRSSLAKLLDERPAVIAVVALVLSAMLVAAALEVVNSVSLLGASARVNGRVLECTDGRFSRCRVLVAGREEVSLPRRPMLGTALPRPGEPVELWWVQEEPSTARTDRLALGHLLGVFVTLSVLGGVGLAIGRQRASRLRQGKGPRRGQRATR